MADNFIANPGAGGDTFAADEVAGVKIPRSKIVIGADGVNDGDVSAANPLPVNLPSTQRSASGAVLIGNNKSKLRDEFATGGLDPLVWDAIATGAGMSFSTGNGTTGSYLLMTSGTTINSETIIRSKEMFTLPVRLAAFVTASQRIANCEFFVELIEVDPSTGLPVTAVSGGTYSGTYKNYAATVFNGTSATSALVAVRSGAAPEFASAGSTITTTAATGTGPNFFPAGYAEMQVTGEHVALLQGAVDSTANATVARRVSQAAPNPDVYYKLQMRLRNLGTAPASSTDYRVHAIRLFDYTRTDVSVVGGPGHNSGAMAVPVAVASGVPSSTAGAAAHDAAVSGNPVRIGGRALTANYAAVATGDTADIIVTTTGVQIVKPYALHESDWTYAAASGGIINTTDVAVKAAAAPAGIRNYVTSVSLSNNSATATEFVIKDGASTVLWRGHLPGNAPAQQINFPTPLRGTAATAVNVACITTGAAVYCNIQGYIAP